MTKRNFALCRYNFPIAPYENTTLSSLYNDDGSINKILQIARGIGSEYLNSVACDLFSLSKSNGDMKMLTGQNIHYATKYPTKVQQQTFCDSAFKRHREGIEKAFERRFNSDPMNSTQHGKGIIHSLAYQHTNILEVQPTCCSFVIFIILLIILCL